MFAVMNLVIIGLVIAAFMGAVEWSVVGVVFAVLVVFSLFWGVIRRKITGSPL